jgi:2,3,4,5-tetrahydropyridine-2-carboxylate N-succinyltransferase
MTLTEAMSASDLEHTIKTGWDMRDSLTPRSDGPVPRAVMQAVRMMDSGTLRVAEPDGVGGWRVNQWLKQAILLYFRLRRNEEIPGGPGGSSWWDKVPVKFAGWNPVKFGESGFRAVPGSIVRYGAFVAPDAVLMPSFINIGAFVGEGTMIDAWATIGSCAQVGRHCHISGGTGIGGVLEPLQAAPVIIEDNVFIGARSEIAEGVRVEKGAVISMGVFIGASTKIIDRATGEIFQGRVPAGAVVVPGSLPGKNLPDGSPGPSLSCAVIVKRVDEQTRAKTSINELLRAGDP